MQPKPPLVRLKAVSSHPVAKAKIGKEASAQGAEEVMLVVVIYEAFVQLFLMEVSTHKGTGMCSHGLVL